RTPTPCATSFARFGSGSRRSTDVRKCAGTLARVLLLGVIAASCTTRVPPIGTRGTPFTPSAEERRLWGHSGRQRGSLLPPAAREEEGLLRRVATYEDASLDEYLGRVAAKLVPADVGPDGPVIKFVILRDPTLAAFAMPEGRVFVHTGLLSRVENEAQLATIL